MKKKGSALLVVVIIMSIVFTMAIIMIGSTLKSNKQVRKDYYDVQSYYCAETGMNETIDDICFFFENEYDISDYINNQDNLFNNSNASYDVTVNVISSDYNGGNGGGPPGKGKGKIPPGLMKKGGVPPGQSKKGLGNSPGKGNHYGWYKKKKSKKNKDSYDIVIGITSKGYYYDSGNSIYVEIEITCEKNSYDYDFMINYKEVNKL